MPEEEKRVVKEKKVRKREKRKRTGRKHSSIKIWKFYEIKGNEIIRKRQSCPRCGPSVLLAIHKDRVMCGKCGYCEMKIKK